MKEKIVNYSLCAIGCNLYKFFITIAKRGRAKKAFLSLTLSNGDNFNGRNVSFCKYTRRKLFNYRPRQSATCVRIVSYDFCVNFLFIFS